ncbi:hypothetical protein EBZ80_23685 [bacterium]|nr:hypothetical protein [bacterium]
MMKLGPHTLVLRLAGLGLTAVVGAGTLVACSSSDTESTVREAAGPNGLPVVCYTNIDVETLRLGFVLDDSKSIVENHSLGPGETWCDDQSYVTPSATTATVSLRYNSRPNEIISLRTEKNKPFPLVKAITSKDLPEDETQKYLKVSEQLSTTVFQSYNLGVSAQVQGTTMVEKIIIQKA